MDSTTNRFRDISLPLSHLEAMLSVSAPLDDDAVVLQFSI